MPHTIVPDKCTGCTVCALKCPTQAIFGAKDECHTIVEDLCVDCRICGRWCPVEAILDEGGQTVPRIKAKDIPKADVDPDLCTGCEMCVAVCPFDVISMVIVREGDPVTMSNQVASVATKRCTGCQLCEDACIKHAIRVDAGDLDRPSLFQLSNRAHTLTAR